MTYISVFLAAFLFSFNCSAQVRNVESGISFFEKNTITVDMGRGPASVEEFETEKDELLDLSFYSIDPVSDKPESSEYRNGAPFMQFHIKDGAEKKPTGFEFTMTGPNPLAGAPLATGCEPECQTLRRWQFMNKKGSLRETFLVITDDAGSGFLSQQMESVVVLLPRLNRPYINSTAKEFQITLPTGEKVVFDKETKLLKRGVFKEGIIDLNPNRHERKFAPLTYTGRGIMIRSDKRGGDPRVDAQKSIVTQNGKQCEIQNKDLWNENSADFKFSDDLKLIQYINSKCGGKFSL